MIVVFAIAAWVAVIAAFGYGMAILMEVVPNHLSVWHARREATVYHGRHWVVKGSLLQYRPLERL